MTSRTIGNSSAEGALTHLVWKLDHLAPPLPAPIEGGLRAVRGGEGVLEQAVGCELRVDAKAFSLSAGDDQQDCGAPHQSGTPVPWPILPSLLITIHNEGPTCSPPRV